LASSRARCYSRAYADRTREIYDDPSGSLVMNDLTAYEYLISIRQNFLPLHYGNHYILEAYNPNRGAWQFHYDQETPTMLSSLQDTPMDDATFDGYWRPLLRRGSGQRFLIPGMRSRHPKFSWYYQREHFTNAGEFLSHLSFYELASYSATTVRVPKRLLSRKEIPPSDMRPSGFIGLDTFYRRSQTGMRTHMYMACIYTLLPYMLISFVSHCFFRR
jgi:hypothetical protein